MFPSIAAHRRAAALPSLLAVILCTALATAPARAAEVPRAIEQVLAAAQQEKRGVALHVAGQVIAGVVVRIEPGQWVELRNQQFGRIVVRLDRVDAAAMP
jgi:hypothetical protein